MDSSYLSLKVGDFVLVELKLEEGRNLGSSVCFVARVEEFLEDGTLDLTFLRIKNPAYKDSFTFPTIEDRDSVAMEQVKGVLLVLPRTTARQAHLVKVRHPLSQFKMM